MPQKVLKFAGINRAVNEFQAAGACEELVNLRPSAYGLNCVRKKKVLIGTAADEYKFIVEHSFGSESNFLAATADSVIWIEKDGTHRQTIISSVNVSNISYAGNVVVITMSDGAQKTFRFLEDSYQNYATVVPSIRLSVALSDFTASAFGSRANLDDIGVSREALSNAMSLFYKKNIHGLAGPILIGCTFELEDGNEVWSSGFSIIDPTKDVRFTNVKNTESAITVYGAKKATLSFDIVNNFSNASGIKNIKFYSSTPLTPYEVQTVEDTDICYAVKIDNKEINLAGQPMYLQKTLSFRKSGEFLLNTEYALAANDLMPVTAGAISRTGDVVSYNNRFHYYDSDVVHTLQGMSYGVHSNRELPEASNTVDIRSALLCVVIDNGKKRILVQESKSINVQISTKMDFIYPLGGIKEGYLKTFKADGGVSWYKIEFNDSESYNFSYALDYMLSVTCDAPSYDELIEVHGQSIYLREETNAINVSAPYNPFVFPVNYSYSFGGEVLDVVTSYLPISSTQIGQYPLTVFTNNGIYALEQGSGAVLYGNIVPLQPMVIDGHAKATPHGIFFFSSRSLYALVGREVVDISLAIKGKLEQSLRNTNGYNAIVDIFFGKPDSLTDIDFEDFSVGATLAYDQLNNELYISNTPKEGTCYSYVFNLDTKAFHTLDRCYIQHPSEYRYTLEHDMNQMDVVDLHTEEDTTKAIFLQSRPFALDTLYSHINRLLMLVDAKLEGDQSLSISVFASDNLHDWKCIISAQKKNTVLRHIRTNRAAKSYRDYVIVISGLVGTDTDLSDIIADYTTVSRRLG